MVVVCVMPPPVAVIVKFPVRGVGPFEFPPPLLPPPQETVPRIKQSASRLHTILCNLRLDLRVRRRFAPGVVNTIPTANAKLAKSPNPRCCKGKGAPRSRVNTAPLMVTSAVPLPPVTVVGLMVQVVVPSDDATLHVSATSELKPPVGVIVRLLVIMPPLGIETTGLATVRVKSAGTALTVTGITRLCVIFPLVAVTVTAPVAAVLDAFTVSVLV